MLDFHVDAAGLTPITKGQYPQGVTARKHVEAGSDPVAVRYRLTDATNSFDCVAVNDRRIDMQTGHQQHLGRQPRAVVVEAPQADGFRCVWRSEVDQLHAGTPSNVLPPRSSRSSR